MIAIETVNLSKHYKDIIAVDNINFSVQYGELFSLLGVNGAGKSTTIKMLSCLIKPTYGDAFLLGKSIQKQTQSIKQEINISPQETAIAPNLTVKENLELIAGIYGQNKIISHKNANEMAKAFGLTNIMKRRAKTLSGGMQRRLSIAMALISNPKILFLDEPTLGLDVIARHELWKIIQSLKGSVTIILTTHYLEEAEALSDRVGIMMNGKLISKGTVAEITAKTDTNTLEETFLTLVGGVQ